MVFPERSNPSITMNGARPCGFAIEDRVGPSVSQSVAI